MRTEHSFQKKAVISAMAGLIVGIGFAQTELAYAGLQGVLNGMLVAAGSPSVFSDQQSEVFSGGYINASVPNQQYNVISFAPPNISGGCGGINLFMGSFSFISAQQFEQMLQQIGEGLLTFAFYSAISSMCQTCTTILQTLENAMQTMNNAMRNTCQLGSGIGIENLAGSLGKAAGEFQNAFTAGQGLFNSFFSGASANQQTPGSVWNQMKTSIQTVYTKTTKAFTNEYDAATNTYHKVPVTTTTPVKETAPMFSLTYGLGNNTWHALANSQAQTIIGQGSYTIGENNVNTLELLMSIIGTEIVLKPNIPAASALSSSSSGAGTQSIPANTHPGPPEPSILTLQQLVNGGQNVNFYTCLPGNHPHSYQYGINNPGDIDIACLHLGTAPFSSIGYQGIKQYVQNMLFGGDTPGTTTVSPAGVTTTTTTGQTYHNGFVNDEMNLPTTTNPSPTMQQFISVLPISIEADARAIETDAALQGPAKQAALFQLAMFAKPYIVDAFAVEYGQAILEATEIAFDHSDTAAAPPGFQTTINTIQSAISHYQAPLNLLPSENAAELSLIEKQNTTHAVKPL